MRAIDFSAAEKAPGVKAVLAIVDPAKGEAKVMYQGDEVAAVAAETEDQARMRHG